MSEEKSGRRRERWIAAAIVVLLVLVRSAVFVFWEQSHFDSDQAIIGLMAKHLLEGRAFPVFYYGQNYMLGVEAYLAVPVFAIAGVSVTTLKLPLLAINLAVALLLLRMFERDGGLRPMAALVPVLFFAVPSPAMTANILAPNGGNLAPFAYTILIWLTRRRPAWCGFFFGLGFLHREFTIYALGALIAVEIADGTLRTRDGLWRRLRMFRTAAQVWLVVQVLKFHSSAAGPGTSTADLAKQRDSVLELTDRWCGDLSALPQGVARLFSDHWGLLFGARPVALADLSIQSAGSQGITGGWIVLAIAVVLPLAAIAHRLLTERRWRPEYNVCAYLVFVGLFSQAGYVVGRCGQLHSETMRYEMLSVLAAAGLGAWFLQIAAWPRLRAAWIGAACLMTAITGAAHGRLLFEYVRHTPDNPKRLIAMHLEARGIKYALADYWRAYATTFLSDERVIVASDNYQRIRVYREQVEAHHDQAVRLAREYCPGGRPVLPQLWVCPF